jgi:hypothetical protein
MVIKNLINDNFNVDLYKNKWNYIMDDKWNKTTKCVNNNKLNVINVKNIYVKNIRRSFE